MMGIKSKFLEMVKSVRGTTAIEYGLIASLIAAVIVGAIGATGTNLGEIYNESLQVIIDHL